MTKAADIRAKTTDELGTMLLDLRKEQFNLRFQKATGQNEGVSRGAESAPRHRPGRRRSWASRSASPKLRSRAERRGRCQGRVLTGRVTSDKMDKTITRLGRASCDAPAVQKFIRRSKKYAAHDEANTCKVGDTVRIMECPPISKRKTWTVFERNGTVMDDVSADVIAAIGTHPASPPVAG